MTSPRTLLAIAVASGTLGGALAGCGSSGTTTVTVNSAACVQAAQAAGKFATIAGNAIQAAGSYAPLIEQGTRAGLEQNTAQVYAVAAREKQITARMDVYAKQMAKLNNSFNPTPGSCS